MAKKVAANVTVSVAILIIAVLLLFGCDRSADYHHETGHGNDHHMEEEEMGHHHEEGHFGGPAGESHSEDPGPTGKLVDGVRVIEMKARKFEFDPAKVVVRSGEKVRLKVTSEDVKHGIDIEGYEIDRDLKPGETEIIEFTAGKPGNQHFHCSVYCGKGHNKMHGTLVVIED